MNVETKAAQTVGCYDLRTVDFETVLIGPVTELIDDADRLVRRMTRLAKWWCIGLLLTGAAWLGLTVGGGV